MQLALSVQWFDRGRLLPIAVVKEVLNKPRNPLSKSGRAISG